MRIFVAGATGVVGRLLIPKLLHAGHEVIGMTRTAERKSIIEDSGVYAVTVDAFDREGIRSLLDDIRPDVVIHQLTSLADRDFAENTRIRVNGTRNLVDASLQSGVKKMIVQSVAWAYEAGDDPASEDVPLDIDAPAPRKRLVDGIVALEQAASEVPEHVILRYGLFYGPGTWYAGDGFMAEQVRQQKVAATTGVTSFIHVEDAVNAAFLAVDWPTGIVNIVDDEPAAGMDWVPVYAGALGAPLPVVQTEHEPWERGASNAKARKELDWEPKYPTWKTGLPNSIRSTC
ncbi:NAD-dependent epimerase/dehydratase family protein [Ferroacidibacillus organovorans]|uniref:dTDP-glucose 4,6-dehydratase n=1 Tax=Ferroacidibacillus organovorans TaxID=1765683 RepID=A0A853K6S8_9BACL|nr:NAD(P)-dependent oxidoreductase [Ferroacidibacillus organovorans]KYP79262.1 dTDP-glucose 4,6-dehydratase [Ferroacidibacillus organovorans]OAG87905.1 dTDP-glucose 4,6-dehydratase [Ferroacidibacillus organovorans]